MVQLFRFSDYYLEIVRWALSTATNCNKSIRHCTALEHKFVSDVMKNHASGTHQNKKNEIFVLIVQICLLVKSWKGIVSDVTDGKTEGTIIKNHVYLIGRGKKNQ